MIRTRSTTANGLLRYIDQTALWFVGRDRSISVRVRIIDARTRFGTVDVCIVPEAGEGSTWVEAATLTLEGSR